MARQPRVVVQHFLSEVPRIQRAVENALDTAEENVLIWKVSTFSNKHPLPHGQSDNLFVGVSPRVDSLKKWNECLQMGPQNSH